MDFIGWLILQIFKGGGFVLEYWRWFLGGAAAIVLIFVLPEKMRHLSNSITKMIDAAYLLLGRITRYLLVVAVIAVTIYGSYRVGNWRETPKSSIQSSAARQANRNRQTQEPTAQELAEEEYKRQQAKRRSQ